MLGSCPGRRRLDGDHRRWRPAADDTSSSRFCALKSCIRRCRSDGDGGVCYAAFALRCSNLACASVALMATAALATLPRHSGAQILQAQVPPWRRRRRLLRCFCTAVLKFCMRLQQRPDSCYRRCRNLLRLRSQRCSNPCSSQVPLSTTAALPAPNLCHSRGRILWRQRSQRCSNSCNQGACNDGAPSAAQFPAVAGATIYGGGASSAAKNPATADTKICGGSAPSLVHFGAKIRQGAPVA